MQILLTNDDGIYAPGLAALEVELQKLGQVTVVAPATEQSGVGHSITFLKPLVAHEIYQGNVRRGWAVEGSPADSVKLGILEICQQRPDLIVSGMNSGLNAGINVLYSGTVAAAIEGAFFGIPSVAVSLEFNEHADLPYAASLARQVIEHLIAKPHPTAKLFNLNIPSLAERPNPELKIVPMGIRRYGETFEKRVDPRGRNYYWASMDPPPTREGTESDLTALAAGYLTLTPLNFDMTRYELLAELRDQDWTLQSGG